MKVTGKLKFEPRDLWLGVYWNRTKCVTERGEESFTTEVWVCLIPCLPIHVTFWHDVNIQF